VGNVAAGQPCGTQDTGNCQAGSQCFNDDAGNGVCRQFCRLGDAAACGGTGDCFGFRTQDGPVPGVGFCQQTTACDIFAQDCATAGQGCYLNPNSGRTACATAGEIPIGGTCDPGVCVPGGLCVTVEGAPAPTCLKVCRVADGTGCEAGQTCNRLTQNVPDVGVCIGQ
jgi:hypothetical protein